MTSEITSKLGLQTANEGGTAGGAATQKSKGENLKQAQQFRDLAEKVFLFPEGPNDGWGEILVPSRGENSDLPRPPLDHWRVELRNCRWVVGKGSERACCRDCAGLGQLCFLSGYRQGVRGCWALNLGPLRALVDRPGRSAL